MRITSALDPWRFEDDYTIIFMRVWFEEYGGTSLNFAASLFDCEAHGKELWFRAMKGEYGPIEVRDRLQETEIIEPPRMLTYDNNRS